MPSLQSALNSEVFDGSFVAVHVLKPCSPDFKRGNDVSVNRRSGGQAWHRAAEVEGKTSQVRGKDKAIWRLHGLQNAKHASAPDVGKNVSLHCHRASEDGNLFHPE